MEGDFSLKISAVQNAGSWKEDQMREMPMSCGLELPGKCELLVQITQYTWLCIGRGLPSCFLLGVSRIEMHPLSPEAAVWLPLSQGRALHWLCLCLSRMLSSQKRVSFSQLWSWGYSKCRCSRLIWLCSYTAVTVWELHRHQIPPAGGWGRLPSPSETSETTEPRNHSFYAFPGLQSKSIYLNII